MQPISVQQSSFSQVEPFNGVLISLLSVPPSVPSFSHEPCHADPNPADVLGHLGVDSVFALACAALPPAHDPSNKVSGAVARDVRATAVPLASILVDVIIASTEHLLGNAQLGGFHADLPTHIGDCEALKDGGWLSAFAEATKTTDHTVGLPHEYLHVG